jgi:hypothetical protein
MPLLIAMLITTNRDASVHQRIGCHWIFQALTFASFLVIVFMYPYSNFPVNMSYPGNSRDITPLFVLLVSIYAIPMQDVLGAGAQTRRCNNLIISALCKILAFTVATLCMHTGATPDHSAFERLHDFYSLRIVSHIDPQFELDLLGYLVKFCASHLTKLVALVTSCVWFGKLFELKIFSALKTDKASINSRNEMVFVCTVILVMMAALATSKQHNYNHSRTNSTESLETHSVVMMWTILLTIGGCITVALACCRPFEVNQISRNVLDSLETISVAVGKIRTISWTNV